MGKFYGAVGFGLSEQKETSPGVWEVVPVEKMFYGDILTNVFRNENSGTLNDNITVTNKISIVADPYAHNNFQHIKYVKWRGVAWKVISVEEQFPRLILTLGGVSNVD